MVTVYRGTVSVERGEHLLSQAALGTLASLHILLQGQDGLCGRRGSLSHGFQLLCLL